MNLLGIIKPTEIQEPIRRFASGWSTMGAVTRPADTRTPNQITQTLIAYSKKIPEVKKFITQLGKAPIETKRLATDVIELSQSKTMLLTDVSLTDKVNNKSFLEALLNDIIIAGKSNKPAVNFASTVINNTDNVTSKYFLRAASSGILKHSELGEHFSETSKIIPDIAQDTLGGGYTGDFSKQTEFMDIIKSLTHPKTNTQRIEEFPKVIKSINELPQNRIYDISIDDFTRSAAPKSQVADNLTTLKSYVKLMEDNGKEPNIMSYLTKNTNLY